jgi:4-amino-4-deoxy-L-arabinose transferase-like glycosyltransferase
MRLFGLIAILLLAFALRVAALDSVPPGLSHDEVAQLGVADMIQAGDWRIFYPDNYGVEPLYHYGLAAALAVWGRNSLAMRLPEVFASMVGLACLYVLGARLFSKRVGWLAMVLAAVTWWSIILGRVVLREGWQIPLYALALYAFWRGFEPALRGQLHISLGPFALSGLVLGLQAYIYTVSRGLLGVFVLFGLYLLIVQRAIFKRVWRGLLVTLGVTLLFVTSLQLYTAAHPEFEDIAPVALLQDGPISFLEQLPGVTARTISHFLWLGDADSEFNLPYRPMFNPGVTALFVVGLGLSLRRFRNPAYMLVLIAWGIVLVPTILFNAHFPFTRLSAAQPLAFILIGLGADYTATVARRIQARRAVALGLGLAFGLLLVFSLLNTVQEMYVDWPADAKTRTVYNTELRQLSRWMQIRPGPLAQCTLWIIFPQDPKYHQSIAQLAAKYFDYPLTHSRWHDCRYSLVIPAGGQFVFAHSDLHPLEDFLGRGLATPWLENAQPLEGVPDALQVDARAALQAKQAEWDQLSVIWPPEAVLAGDTQLPVDFNHAIELIGYQLEPRTVKPGDNVRVVTYWRVSGDLPADLIAFTHLYRTPADVIAQQDQLDVAGPSLRPGDVFVQAHDFVAVPPNVPAGAYLIGVGLYHQDTGERWPIYLADQRVADRIFLAPVQVTP